MEKLIRVKNKNGATPLHNWMKQCSNSTQLMDLVVKYKMTLNDFKVVDRQGRFPLALASFFKSPDCRFPVVTTWTTVFRDTLKRYPDFIKKGDQQEWNTSTK